MFNFKARRNLLVDEKNMPAILGVLDKHKIRDVSLGNCGWADFTNRWFIFFTASEKSYSSVMKDLTKILVNLIVSVVPALYELSVISM